MRINFDTYFMKICDTVALRATCPRKNVGAIVVKDGRILSTGYNGAPKGFAHCTDVGCRIENNHCVRVIHAEENALLFAGKEAIGATLYCTTLPCQRCLKLAIQAGISKIIFKEDYNKEKMRWIFDECQIEIIKYNPETDYFTHKI